MDYSEIAKTAVVSSSASIEYPIHCGPQSQIHANTNIGKFLFLNFYSTIFPNVTLGRYCSVARFCEIGVAEHPLNYLSTHSFQYHSAQFPKYPNYKDGVKRVRWLAHKKTVIGNDVWIGSESIILGGITIGDGAVIAANSVVTKDVEPYSIVAGSPAKLIRKRFSDEIIHNLLELKWWELSFDEISSLPFDDIEKCVIELKDIRNNNILKKE